MCTIFYYYASLYLGELTLLGHNTLTALPVRFYTNVPILRKTFFVWDISLNGQYSHINLISQEGTVIIDHVGPHLMKN